MKIPSRIRVAEVQMRKGIVIGYNIMLTRRIIVSTFESMSTGEHEIMAK